MAKEATVAVVKAELDRFNSALRNRDATLARSFHRTAIFLGSEPGELALGNEAIARLFEAIMRSSSTVQFEWARIEARRAGRTTWFLADGEVCIAAPHGETRRPYSLTGVLELGRAGWRWRLFHGSEPWISPSPAP